MTYTHGQVRPLPVQLLTDHRCLSLQELSRKRVRLSATTLPQSLTMSESTQLNFSENEIILAADWSPNRIKMVPTLWREFQILFWSEEAFMGECLSASSIAAICMSQNLGTSMTCKHLALLENDNGPYLQWQSMFRLLASRCMDLSVSEFKLTSCEQDISWMHHGTQNTVGIWLRL